MHLFVPCLVPKRIHVRIGVYLRMGKVDNEHDDTKMICKTLPYLRYCPLFDS